MRKVLIIAVLLVLNLLIIGGQAQGNTSKLTQSRFYCKNKSWLKRRFDHLIKARDYLMVLETGKNYKDLVVQKHLLEKKLANVKILELFEFKLAILQKGDKFMLVENSCFTKSDALSNMKTLAFFFNIKGSVIQAKSVQSFGRTPAATAKIPLYFINE